jgi:hypothetical protein
VTLPKVPRRMAWRSMMPNQSSTRFIHDADVGVKCTCTRGFASSQVQNLGPLVGGVVVHHEVQLSVGVGAGDLFEEAQELLVPVPRLAGRGHRAGGDLQGREQCGGAVSHIIMGAPLGQPWLHRQDRRGAIQGVSDGLCKRVLR